MVIQPLMAISVARPIPITSTRSSIALNGPRAMRWSTMALGVHGADARQQGEVCGTGLVDVDETCLRRRFTQFGSGSNVYSLILGQMRVSTRNDVECGYGYGTRIESRSVLAWLVAGAPRCSAHGCFKLARGCET